MSNGDRAELDEKFHSLLVLGPNDIQYYNPTRCLRASAFDGMDIKKVNLMLHRMEILLRPKSAVCIGYISPENYLTRFRRVQIEYFVDLPDVLRYRCQPPIAGVAYGEHRIQ